MCLIICAHLSHPDYPFAVAANRDEFFSRPTASAGFWSERPSVLAGRDLQAGGTWMGLSRSGRFAAVTNFRDPGRSGPGRRSRGELPLLYLDTEQSIQQVLATIRARARDYAGFSILLGEGEELWFFSNADQGAARRLAPGIYGLSNASLDTPWPKLLLGKQRMQEVLASPPLSHDRLQWTVQDRQLAPAGALRALELNEVMDQQLSAQFIQAGHYGTRSTTSLWREPDGALQWRECSFDSQGNTTRTEDYRIDAED